MNLDERIRELLAESSEAFLGMKCTSEQTSKYKFYTPLASSKEDSSLPPLAGGKVLPSTIIEDMICHAMVKNPAMQKMAEAIFAGSKLRLVLSVTSLYFSAETKCRLFVKVERIQLIEAGNDVAEVADYSFDD